MYKKNPLNIKTEENVSLTIRVVDMEEYLQNNMGH